LFAQTQNEAWQLPTGFPRPPHKCHLSDFRSFDVLFRNHDGITDSVFFLAKNLLKSQRVQTCGIKMKLILNYGLQILKFLKMFTFDFLTGDSVVVFLGW
jgi:hypothetical protein